MERLFGAIPDVLKQLGPDGGADEALVFAAWKDCAGPLITERTEVVEYFEKRLVIAVRDPSWRAHLIDLSPQMIARLNGELGDGKVKFIEFREGVRKADPKKKNVEKREAGPVQELPPSLSQAADAIADAELRQTFLEAAAVYLAKK